MSLLFVCYPKCTTCQKARIWLDSHGISYEFRDIKTDRPTLGELHTWFSRSGLPIKRFWNTSGQSYRSLSIRDNLPDMSAEEQLGLLSADGMLVKRPILVGDSFALVGFKEDEWEKQLNK